MLCGIIGAGNAFGYVAPELGFERPVEMKADAPEAGGLARPSVKRKPASVKVKALPAEGLPLGPDPEFHTATSIETPSDIASSERMRDLYPETKLYGSGGRLQILLRLNPSLRNGVVRPGKKVLLIRSVSEAGARTHEEFEQARAPASQGTLSSEEIEAIKLKFSNVSYYRAVHGDTMASLALRFFAGPKLYGVGGRLELLLKLNPHIENQNEVYPNDLILIDPLGEIRGELDRQQAEKLQAILPSRKEIEALEKHPDRIPASDAAAKDALAEYFSWLRMEPTATFYRLDVQDRSSFASGTIVSALSPGFRLAWMPQIGTDTHAGVGLNWSSAAWEVPYGRVLLDPKTSFMGIYGELGHSLSRRAKLTLRAGQREVPVLRALTPQVMSMEKAPLMNAEVEATVSIFSVGPFEGGIRLGVGTSFGGSTGTTEIARGTYYRTGLELAQKLERFTLRGGIHYRNETFSTSFSNNQFQELELGLGVSIPLGR